MKKFVVTVEIGVEAEDFDDAERAVNKYLNRVDEFFGTDPRGGFAFYEIEELVEDDES